MLKLLLGKLEGERKLVVGRLVLIHPICMRLRHTAPYQLFLINKKGVWAD